MTHINRFLLLTAITYLSACHVALLHDDLLIINHCHDSLYYSVNAFKKIEKRANNLALERVYNYSTDKTTYPITGYTLAPGDSTRTGKLDTTMKEFAIQNGGITILFYKKNIEKLPHGNTLMEKDIFRRIDLTPEQLEKSKYTVIVN